MPLKRHNYENMSENFNQGSTTAQTRRGNAMTSGGGYSTHLGGEYAGNEGASPARATRGNAYNDSGTSHMGPGPAKMDTDSRMHENVRDGIDYNRRVVEDGFKMGHSSDAGVVADSDAADHGVRQGGGAAYNDFGVTQMGGEGGPPGSRPPGDPANTAKDRRDIDEISGYNRDSADAQRGPHSSLASVPPSQHPALGSGGLVFDGPAATGRVDAAQAGVHQGMSGGGHVGPGMAPVQQRHHPQNIGAGVGGGHDSNYGRSAAAAPGPGHAALPGVPDPPSGAGGGGGGGGVSSGTGPGMRQGQQGPDPYTGTGTRVGPGAAAYTQDHPHAHAPTRTNAYSAGQIAQDKHTDTVKPSTGDKIKGTRFVSLIWAGMKADPLCGVEQLAVALTQKPEMTARGQQRKAGVRGDELM
ncbi:hypothetical protein R3P38DRAFT_3357301 [Favolaschia claudopus]|uniref:Uncharacterized protein n=1 Tax=Favolaschia claudopus TaxID=2862362 RepID=A0AAW0B8G4_9AGAR